MFYGFTKSNVEKQMKWAKNHVVTNCDYEEEQEEKMETCRTNERNENNKTTRQVFPRLE